MPKKKSPYGKNSVEQVLASEATSYVIVAGSDFLNVKGKMAFDKQTAIRYYKSFFKELITQLYSGRKRQSNHAKYILSNYRIESLRIH